MGEKVLLIGSGGREHAICWSLSKSEDIKHIYVTPGNAGTSSKSGNKVSNVDVDIKNHDVVIKFCRENCINFVVVGPENPLADGIQDSLSSVGIPCFGPSKQAARIESSKVFAKKFMDRHNIPTADWHSFTTCNEAYSYIDHCPHEKFAIKVDGLAAGKGVYLATSKEEAKKSLDILFRDKPFGDAGHTVIIEELLTGCEASVLCFTDGITCKVMLPAQDYKRLNVGDVGPNTGGMGACCPYRQLNDSDVDIICKSILHVTIDGLRDEGTPFTGVLYAGLMITKSGPKVLEFNCRFGDPETQVILPLLKSDLYNVMKSCVNGNLSSVDVSWYPNKYAVATVLVSEGYPASYSKGKIISGLNEAEGINGIEVFHAGTNKSEIGESILTCGGRVMAVVGISEYLQSAIELSRRGAKMINFDNKFYRSDIGDRTVPSDILAERLSYESSGVDVKEGNRFVSSLKTLCSFTNRPGVIGSIGGFGGLFSLHDAGFDSDSFLVSGADGVGTKLLVAQKCKMNFSIGIDLVAMCVNDVLAHAAQPLFFLDYFACGKLDTDLGHHVMSGIVEGCRQAGCALIGGETAEMPGMYDKHSDAYDLAGFCVGAVKRQNLLPKTAEIRPGDILIGLSSSGLHSNGFSLVRNLVDLLCLQYGDPAPFSPQESLGHALLKPTKIYTSLLPIILKCKAFVHVTGGGLIENIPRVLPEGYNVTLDACSWTVPEVFKWIATQGNVDANEMLRTFNCGVGAVLILDKDQDCNDVISKIQATGETVWKIGNVGVIRSDGEAKVLVKNFEETLKSGSHNPVRRKERSRVGVLISGSGTNLQALINASKKPNSSYRIVLVISNVDGVQGLTRANDSQIKSKVVSHKSYKSREEFDMVIHEELKKENVEFVCLAGFMRILSSRFVRLWNGKLINTHPSLLPSFRGLHAVRQALEAGVSVAGCTVHFVAEDIDAGAIITQETVPVHHDDDENELHERIKLSEHRAYPRALQLLTSGKIQLGPNGNVQWRSD